MLPFVKLYKDVSMLPRAFGTPTNVTWRLLILRVFWLLSGHSGVKGEGSGLLYLPDMVGSSEPLQVTRRSRPREGDIRYF